MPRTRTASSAGAKTMPTGARRQGRAAFHLTCSNCRTRKIKCDSNQPECRICLAYGERCHYDKPPPMSQVLAMANRIQELEKALEDERRRHRPPENVAGTSTDLVVLNRESMTAPQTPLTSSSGAPIVASPLGNEGQDAHPHQNSPYYDSTSSVHEPTRMREELALDAASVSATPGLFDGSQQLLPIAMSEHQLAFWEETAVANCTAMLQLPMATVAHLLRTHWSWVHPTFMFVSKPIFLRDAATGGKYFSQLLLCVICLHSTRFTDHALGEDLRAKVRLLLGRELHAEPNLPCIQALLQLSAYEVGKGELSQAWLYSGMAFRMAVDLGIFAAPKSSLLDDPVKQRVTRQVAWSCYLWDKAISLYLGRVPVLSEPPSFNPPVADDIVEHDTWTPYYGKDESGKPGILMPSITVTAFANFCSLATIISDILMTIYAKKLTTDARAFVRHTRQRLEIWRTKTPGNLFIDPNSQEQECPPPHIMIQK